VIFSAVLPEERQAWSVMLKIVALLGVAHFSVGLIFQVRTAIKQQFNLKRFYGSLVAVSFLTLFFIALLYTFNLHLFAWALTFVYFMLHGTLNEITLFQRSFPESRPPRELFAAIGAWFCGIGLASIGHPSSLSTTDFGFLQPVASHYILLIHESFFLLSKWVGYGLIVVSFVISFWSFRRQDYQWWHVSVMVLSFCGLGWLVFVGPLHYLYLFSILLSYHFILWSLVTHERSQPGHDRRLHRHAHLITLCIGVLAIFGGAQFLGLDWLRLSAEAFFTLSMIHISTSFLNEPIFQSWFKAKQI
jgi:hypothetical protein